MHWVIIFVVFKFELCLAVHIKYKEGSRSVDHVNCSLVIPVNRQGQSGGC